MAYAKLDFRERVKRISVLKLVWVLFIGNMVMNRMKNNKTNIF